ncbi:MAG: transcription termination factor Rho [Phycisphaerae bacterium SM23_30]|nr:MAG: transcription termination factor Rho [Phycisphaerae bacterium SM23_30]
MGTSDNNMVEGLLEITDRGHGFLRDLERDYRITPRDPFVSRNLIGQYFLREGMVIRGAVSGHRGRNPNVSEIESINGRPLEEYEEFTNFEDFVVVDPQEMIRLETGAEPLGTRVMDLLTPIGKGQRGLIVASPRTGKTILLQQIAHGITTNHPEIHLMMLLIDERPEEVTDIRRNVQGEVVASCNDKGVESHVRMAQLGLERVKRQVEMGADVVVLLDSITRLGRAFNSWVGSSGRTMSGGVDIRALQLPKQIFGSARNAEGGGSLTIIATALIDTGSRMDEVIFQEFKGTGNMELVLDRNLANKRIFPAIDISQSGTRKEELLIEPETLEKIVRLRRHLDSLAVGQDVETLVKALKKHPSNESFLTELP